MSKVPLLNTKCSDCKHLTIVNGEFSCIKNRVIPKMVPPEWATHCSKYNVGKKQRKKTRIFFTRQFGVRITPDYKSVIVVAKAPYKLMVKQADEEKVVIESVEEG